MLIIFMEKSAYILWVYANKLRLLKLRKLVVSLEYFITTMVYLITIEINLHISSKVKFLIVLVLNFNLKYPVCFQRLNTS